MPKINPRIKSIDDLLGLMRGLILYDSIFFI